MDYIVYSIKHSHIFRFRLQNYSFFFKKRKKGTKNTYYVIKNYFFIKYYAQIVKLQIENYVNTMN